MEKYRNFSLFFHFDSDPRFSPFLLYVRWKFGVTFVRRCFRDEISILNLMKLKNSGNKGTPSNISPSSDITKFRSVVTSNFNSINFAIFTCTLVMCLVFKREHCRTEWEHSLKCGILYVLSGKKSTGNEC